MDPSERESHSIMDVIDTQINMYCTLYIFYNYDNMLCHTKNELFRFLFDKYSAKEDSCNVKIDMYITMKLSNVL